MNRAERAQSIQFAVSLESTTETQEFNGLTQFPTLIDFHRRDAGNAEKLSKNSAGFVFLRFEIGNSSVSFKDRNLR